MEETQKEVLTIKAKFDYLLLKEEEAKNIVFVYF